MITAMEIDTKQELQDTSPTTDFSYDMDLDLPIHTPILSLEYSNFKQSNHDLCEYNDYPLVLKFVSMSSILHRYYSYILYNTIRLFPLKFTLQEEPKVLMIEGPKNAQTSIDKKVYYEIEKESPVKGSFLPLKRKMHCCSMGIKHMKLSYYNDNLIF
ncbi:hypothetical protein SteCoe_151 [Stentor coeruleus]|uniref:Uncharacterized protein n=1 Tax=Stentor coeruleus TaxID=5963 RepID=A0A1R2D4M9_9CILI|nr:hypothetical protein SteCoe_151 [Stentor coeruleus]